MSDLAIRKNTNKQNLKAIEKFFYESITKPKRIVIMTIGNILLSDDGVGPMVYNELTNKIKNDSLLLINAELNPENYIRTILRFKPTHVIMIDAIEANLAPGTILFFKNTNIENKLFSQASTHMISILNINQRILDENEEYKILNIGIQVKSTEFGLQSIQSDVYESAMMLTEYLSNILMKIFGKKSVD